jgi:hypothetical protein
MNDRLKDHRVAVRLTDQETEDDRLGSTPAPSSERYLSETDGALRAIAIASLLGAALIHLLNLPGTMREVPYVGWLSIAPDSWFDLRRGHVRPPSDSGCVDSGGGDQRNHDDRIRHRPDSWLAQRNDGHRELD